MTISTRDQLLATARTLFAERGFYGVSIASIANEHGLTKQALLHHFSSKEKLYGEVLKEIADDFAAIQLGDQRRVRRCDSAVSSVLAPGNSNIVG